MRCGPMWTRRVRNDKEFYEILPSFVSFLISALQQSTGLRYKNLGKSGLRVSNVALGTWWVTRLNRFVYKFNIHIPRRSVFSNGITEEQSEAIIKLAYESGINLFDLSDLHSGPRAELEMGAILKKMNWKRMTYIVTTKIYWSTKWVLCRCALECT